MLKKITVMIVVACFFMTGYAQENDPYKIEIKIKQYRDTVLYLANYYGDKTYIADTAYCKKANGNFVFSKEKTLEGGLYIIVSQDKKSLFEFLLSDSFHMKLETSADDYVAKMKVKNSEENRVFFEYLSYSGDLFKQIKPLKDDLKRWGPDNDSSAIIKEQITAINQQMTDYKEAIIGKYPESFLAKFFGLLKDPLVPDTVPTLADGTEDKAYSYYFYKQHFWDFIDLSDDRIVRTPVYYRKLDTYFDQVISKDADSIIYEIDHLLAQMNETGDLYKFTLWHLTVKFDESAIMGHDAILVYMTDHYFLKGKADWLNEQVIKNLAEESDKRRATLIGKQAPNLIMQDTSFQPVNMYDIDKDFTIIYFWDPQCGHCKEETPKLVKFYNEYARQLNVEIFAVCTDTNMVKMKKYIKEKGMHFVNVNGPRAYTNDYHELYNVFSTPIVVVLDKNKKIIAKRLQSEQLAEFIENYIKFKEEE